ncbi:MAG: MFS transporter [Marinilabiliales bacterium]|nr:MAG: MFS transporter [Marinilabiliales bacterium]
MFNRSFWRKLTLLLSSMMTMMAGAVVAPALPQMNRVFVEVPMADVLTRLIITLPALFIAFISPLAGYITDTFGRKKLLLFSLVIYFVGGTSGYYLDSLYLILVGRAVLGIAVAGIMTTVTTLIGDYYQGEERNAFMGMQGAFMGLGGVFFIFFSGILADINWQLPFTIYGFSVPVFVMALVFILEPRITSAGSQHAVSVTEYDKKTVFALYVIVFLAIVCFYMVPVQLPFLLSTMEGVNNTITGMTISISTLFGAIISMMYRRIKRRFSFKTIYMFAFLLMGIGFFAISYAQDYKFVMLSMIISGLGTGLLMPTGNLWLMKLAPESLRGRLIGRLSTSMFIGMFVSPLLVQPLVDRFEIGGAFFVGSIFLFLLTLVFFFWSLKESFQNDR